MGETLELHTLGYVIDNLKNDEYAIKVKGQNQGEKLYISLSGHLCADNQRVSINMTYSGKNLKNWAIVKKEQLID